MLLWHACQFAASVLPSSAARGQVGLTAALHDIARGQLGLTVALHDTARGQVGLTVALHDAANGQVDLTFAPQTSVACMSGHSLSVTEQGCFLQPGQNTHSKHPNRVRA